MRRTATPVVFTLLLATSLGCQCAKSPCSVVPAEGVGAEVCIPGRTFLMGHSRLPKPKVEPGVAYIAMPANDWVGEHAVTLGPFLLDRFEVSWGQYLPCVEAGICSTSGLSVLPSTREALRRADMADRPAYGIRYAEAALFCAWSGRRLPNEAEWELAARGGDDRDYPWGSSLPSDSLLKAPTFYVADRRPSTYPLPVGSQELDTSVDGIHDLFGSVPEWVADWYDPFYYQRSTATTAGPPLAVFIDRVHEYGEGNLVGAAGGRVVRGNRWNVSGGQGWDLENRGAPVWFREQMLPDFGVGFRCARDGDSEKFESKVGLYRNVTWKNLPQRRHP